jgi:hypothetical protein
MKFIFAYLVLFFLTVQYFSAAPDATRLPNGSPSPSYWQQKADYRVTARLDVRNSMLHGTGTITYYNNSPDTLKTIVWHLYQNVFRKDSSPRLNEEHSSRAETTTQGIAIETLTVNGAAPVRLIDETIMETPLTTPVLPKTSVMISVSWNYQIPKDADLRTGSDGNDFGICQWYPQIAVYDDLHGWDRTQYLGISEFYTEYGNWNVELTVPKNFILASTGTLTNPNDVLTADQLQRFNSLTRDSTTRIILPDEIASTADSVSADSTVWKFSAKNVRDFAWAASPNFVWDGTLTNHGVRIYAFYHPDEYTASVPLLMSDAPNWNEGAAMAKHSIEHFSANFGPYVYPQATVVSGPVVGMEYPMMIFAESGDAVTNMVHYTIAHELGHEWYPMMIGSNETRYPFMDEGFNTYITATAMESHFGSNAMIKKEFLDAYSWMNPPSSNARLFEQRFYLLAARENNEATIMAHPYLIPSNQYGIMAYNKPGSVLVMLEDVIGKETFSRAMNEYYSRWLFKHPYPSDFFNTIEDVSGRDLDWFWNQWFDQTWKLDLAVGDVKNEESNGRWRSTIVLENKEQIVMPATLRLMLADGTARDLRFAETVWDKGRTATIVADSLPATVNNVVIDPDQKLADVNRLNNSWSMVPVVFDYGFNIANTLLFPLDAYRINAGPAVGFNLRDGFELGTNITGSYLEGDHTVSLHTTYGTRSAVPDYELSYDTPIRLWDPQLTTAARVFRLDGFSGWQWTIEKTFEQRKSLLRNYRRSFIINTSILSIRVNDDRYVGNRTEWNTAGHLDAGFISLKYLESFTWGKFMLQLQDEFGTPTSSFSYSKLTAESRFEHSFLGMKFGWRLFGGGSTGAVPSQTAYYMTQASPLERFDSWYARTPVVGASLRDNLVKAGGGNLFLQRDTSAANAAALNVSVSRGPLVLFADAGTLWDSSSTRFKQFYYDAGVGLQFNLGNIMLPGFSTGPIGFGLFFPLYIKDPGRPKDDAFAYRWRFVVGVRL